MTEAVWLFPLWPKIHSHSARAGLGASFTHLIAEASLAGGAGGVVIQSIVRRCHDHISIAVDVDVGRGRAPPFETRCIYSAQFLPLTSEQNWPRRGRRSWCRPSGRRLDRNRHRRTSLEEPHRCIGCLWRLIGVESEIIQCAPANRIGVLVLCKGF